MSERQQSGRIWRYPSEILSVGQNKTLNVPIERQWGAFMQPLFQGGRSKYYVFCGTVCSFRYPTCSAHAPYCHLYFTRLDDIFRYYLLNGTIFGGGVVRSYWIWNVYYDFLYKSVWKFLILKRIQQHKATNVHWYSCKVHVVFLFRLQWILNFLDIFSKNIQI